MSKISCTDYTNTRNNVFGITDWRPYQEEIISAILEKHSDIFAIIPTGGGKSLCYQLPAYFLKGLTIVVEPILALIDDQIKEINHLGLDNFKATTLNSRMSIAEQNRVKEELLNGKYKLLYLSPERLNRPDFKLLTSQLHISMIVADEAHCISLWGHNFRTEYLKINTFISNLKPKPILAAFTATAAPFMVKEIENLIGLHNPLEIFGYKTRDNLNLSLKKIEVEGKTADEQRKQYENSKRNALIRTIMGFYKKYTSPTGSLPAGIIYCSYKGAVNSLYTILSQKKGIGNVAKYHADLSADEKDLHFRNFMTGKCNLMIATNAFGMGINKSDIRFVIHYNMPLNPENYSQEIGRAGRDGLSSDCVLLYVPEEYIHMEHTLKAHYELQLAYKNYDLATFTYELNLKRYRWMHNIYCNPNNDFSTKNESQERAFLLENYFVNNYLCPEFSHENHFMYKGLRLENALWVNTSEIANILRKGNYHPSKNFDYNSIFQISEYLDYFDIMIMDAIYSLWSLGLSSIHIKNIMQLLSGDCNITVKPERMKEIRERILKMQNTKIFINIKDIPLNKESADASISGKLEGAFLPIISSGKNCFKLVEKPPLYLYAELNNCRFMQIPTKYLTVSIGKISKSPVGNSKNIEYKPMPNSIDNIKLKFYIACRVIWATPRVLFPNETEGFSTTKKISPNSRTIRLEPNPRHPERMSLFQYLENDSRNNFHANELNNSTWEFKYYWNRKKKNICSTIESILLYYERIGIIGQNVAEAEHAYKWNKEKNRNGKETIVSITFNFPININF